MPEVAWVVLVALVLALVTHSPPPLRMGEDDDEARPHSRDETMPPR